MSHREYQIGPTIRLTRTDKTTCETIDLRDRRQFITQLGLSGVSLVEAQKLARHSDHKLTANHYTRLSIHDLTSAVSRLAAPRTPHQKVETTKATGTDDSGFESLAPNLRVVEKT